MFASIEGKIKMEKGRRQSFELPKRLFCTLVVLIIFMIGRNIVLYGVDVSSLQSQQTSAQDLVISMLSGDRYICSFFALGITPYITASMLLLLVFVFFPKDVKKRISQQKMEKITLITAGILSVIYAYVRSTELDYVKGNPYFDSFGLQVITIISLILGAFIIIALMQLNKEHGIGQQLPIVLFNIIDGLYTTISGNVSSISYELLLICCEVIVVSIIMENVEVKVPIQRVSIDNAYADKSYIAFKLNPIGVMPVMFSTSIFLLIKYIISFLGELFPNTQSLVWMNLHMNMNETTGVWIYLVIILLFTILFSFIMLSPDDLARNLQRAGDSIVNIYAGKATLRYFRFVIFALSLISGFVMACCMGISFWIALSTSLNQQVAMLPSSLMMLVSMFSNLFNEINGYRKFDSYKFFL